MAESISRTEFDARLEAGGLTLTLVGMSNVGKSLWSARLAEELNFSIVGCDDLIEARLGTVLQDAGYNGGIGDMAKWMGQPYESQSAANQQTYLELESLVLRQTIEQIAQQSLGSNTVIDTTGSVVHTGDEICDALAEHSTVVHLEATPAIQQELFELYVTKPKPVVWGDVYKKHNGQSCEEALATSYPKLLSYRSELYQRIATVTISREISLGLTSARDFLAHVRGLLPV